MQHSYLLRQMQPRQPVRLKAAGHAHAAHPIPVSSALTAVHPSPLPQAAGHAHAVRLILETSALIAEARNPQSEHAPVVDGLPLQGKQLPSSALSAENPSNTVM